MRTLVVAVVGILGGAAGALQSQALGLMEQRAGTINSVFVTYAGGGVAAGLLLLATGGGRLRDLESVPWWAFTAGLMGLVIVGSLGIAVDRLGLGAGLTLFTGATLVSAAAIERMGWFGEVAPLDARRLVGIGLVVFGTWLVVGR